MRGSLPFVVLLLALAGCSGDPGPAPEAPGPEPTATASPTMPRATPDPAAPLPPSPATPGLPTLTLAGCSNRGGTLAAPLEASAALLPDGFEPVPFTDRTGRSGALLYAIAVECEGAVVEDGGTTSGGGPVRFAYLELAVTPPDAYKLPGIDDSTVPLAFVATEALVGDAVAAYGLGLAGTGSLDETAADPTGQGAFVQSFTLDGSTLQFIFGDAAPDTLSVGQGEFAVYGVQDGRVVSILKGTSSGADATANVAAMLFQATGLPAMDIQGADDGFAASGFGLTFEPQPLPTAAR